MSRIRQHITYANVISTVCLFLLLGGGTAVALNGSNTVQSDDLGPGAQVKAADVAANAVNGSRVVDNSLTGADVAGLTGGDVTDNSLNGADVQGLTGGDVTDNSLTGADINEGALFNDNSLNGADLAHNLTLGGATETSTKTLDLNSADGLVTATSWSESPILGGSPNAMAQLEASGGVSAWDCPDGLCAKSGAVDLSGVFGQRLELATIPAPPSPNTGRAFLYITDTGDGRQRLQVKFADGDVDELAIDAP